MSSFLMKMTHFWWCKLAILTIVSILKCIHSLEDITGNIFGSQITGVLSAFGDFNGDKHVDIYVISKDGKSVSVFLASNEDPYEEVVLLDSGNISANHMIVSVVPADFDGDAQMDLLVVMETVPKTDSLVAVQIYWGEVSKLKLSGPLVLPSMVDQPLLLDSDADMVPDLMGEVSPGERRYWFTGEGRNYTEWKVQNASLPPLRWPQSSAFVDLDNDLTADLCVVSTADDGATTQLEFWYNKDGILTFDGNPVAVTNESDIKVVGQFVFADIDGDQVTDIFVPVCADVDCTQSFILLYFNHEKWIKLPMDLVNSGQTWNFIPPTAVADMANLTLPITLRVGDFNLDGYPDLLAILGNATGSVHRAVVLENVPCGDECGGFSRTFAVNWGLWLEQHDELALVAAFIDISDDGVLDMMVTIHRPQQSDLTIQARRHDFVDDACFIKVMVLSGLCNNACPNGREPYGVNQPGPAVRYTMSDLHGNPQHHAASQLCQSAYLPLQLPYTVFGLGQTPNFVDKLQVGIPRNSTHSRYREWTSLIPNSQLVIIPYPVDDPSSWTNKLFVTPSRLMMLTGAALLGTCGFIAGIVAILHWRDKVEDKKEKRQEAQRFHFDAM